VVRSDQAIPAGGTGEIELAVESARLADGAFRKSCRVTTTDPSEPSLELALSGKLRTLLALSPSSIRVPPLPSARPYRADLHLSSPSGTPFQLEWVATTEEPLQVVKAEELEGGQGYWIAVEVGAEARRDPGTLASGTLELEVSLEDGTLHRERTVVSLEFEGRVRTSGRAPYFSRVETSLLAGAATPPEKELVLESTCPEAPLSVLDATMKEDGEGIFEPVLKPLVPGRSYRIAVRPKALSSQKRVQSWLALRTSDPENPVHRMPVVGLFSPRGTPSASWPPLEYSPPNWRS
jgi:hypothetical protein